MNVADAVKFVNQMLQQHRIEVDKRPEITPVSWKGISMTVEEAKLMIHGFESEKIKYQKDMNNAQTGGEITTLATGGAGLAAITTGIALMMFPPTAIAGAITLVGGIGAAGVGKAVGDGVKNIGTNSNVQAIQQIDAYIDSIKNAIIASI